MKSFAKILNRTQKISALKLSILMIVSTGFEILSLHLIFIMLSYFSNPVDLIDNKIFAFIQNFEISSNFSVMIFLLFFCLFLLKNLTIILYSWYLGNFHAKLRAELSSTYFKGYMNLPKLFHTRSNISELIKNITVETEYFVSALSAFQKVILELVMLITITIFLFFIDFKTTLYCSLILFIFSVAIYNFNTKVLSQMGKDRSKYVQSRLKTIYEGLSGFKIFEITGVKKNLLDKFSLFNNKLASISRKVFFRQSLPRPLFELLVLALITVSMVFFLKNDKEIIKTLPMIGTFLAAGYRLIPSFGRIMSDLQIYQFSIAYGSRLSKVKEMFDLNKNNLDKIEIGELKNKFLKISNLNFSYEKKSNDSEKIILKDLNLEIKFGQRIGIKGDSGSGKSSLLDIVMGLVPPREGKIQIDNIDLQDFKLQWQSRIGCVPQDVFISDESLKNNVAFGLNEDQIDDNKVNKALKIANLEDFTNNLKFGVKTLLGENGARVSGGQKQRIGIARAMYHDPDIIILDEATSALDAVNEKKIIEEIFKNTVGKTIIIVSHNEENFRFCDAIFKLENKTLKKISKN
tara:strand:- start:346 stop:2070 length:1725 start_codon:yes stop_codon:yes gene_type:complete